MVFWAARGIIGRIGKMISDNMGCMEKKLNGLVLIWAVRSNWAEWRKKWAAHSNGLEPNPSYHHLI